MKTTIKISLWIFIITCFLACNNQADTTSKPIETFQKDSVESNKKPQTKKGWINLTNKETSFIVAMPYATKDNFLKEKIYPCAQCFLREDAGNALLKAQKTALEKGYSIVLLDCYRPLPMQQKMFDIVPDTKYVGDPKRGSKHNKGVAIDISLADQEGQLLDMGTAFDDFSDKARFDSEEISAEAKKNRTLLREIMLAHDFTPYNNEWWHFNYKVTDYPNEDWIWECDE